VVIAVLRKLLPALCLLVLATIAAWAGLNVIRGRGDGAKIATDANIRMTSLVLQGRTERGQPYLVQAASAVRDNANSAKVTLDKPVLTVGAGGPTWTVVKANSGVYREDTGMLDLSGAVALDDYKGNHLVTEHALVDTKKNNVDGDSHISGHGPLGSIDASSYSLKDGGAYLLFKGRVKSRIYPQHQTPAAPAPAGH
jgi:lipopolysaccharide export system protein LptC